jgi:ParB family chromosome partitioning protein
MAKPVLGRGLSTLLSTGRGPGQAVLELAVGSISPNPRQPRKRFDPQALADLAATIKDKGVAQPVIVRKVGHGFELIAGERRWRASKQAGLRTIPAIVREATDREALELALIENLQRENLNPMEEASSYQLLLKDMTQEEVARRVGRDRATVANTLRLLKLPRDVQDAISGDQVTAGHARAILMLDTPAAQTALCRRIIRDHLSVRQAEALTRRTGRPAARAGGSARLADEELSRALGTKVRIRKAGKRGAILIEFYSEEELERLVALLHKAGR